jgi:hypothetical protein
MKYWQWPPHQSLIPLIPFHIEMCFNPIMKLISVSIFLIDFIKSPQKFNMNLFYLAKSKKGSYKKVANLAPTGKLCA